MSYGSVNSTAGNRATEAASSHADENSSRNVEQGQEPMTAWYRIKTFYHDNIGLFFVFLAQVFAAVMSVMTRLLETGFETKFHALQVVFARMSITALIGSVYLWWKRTPDFPLGPPGVRRLLVLRGFAGTTGLFGLYYSLSFLEVADATVITFLVPSLTGFVCWIALREPFTVREAVAGAIALSGVMFIARPAFLLALLPNRHPKDGDNAHADGELAINGGIFKPVPATPAERSFAIICAVVGSFCAATAYATIRVIGKRVHSLVSVNYFAVTSTITSALVLLIHPEIGFKMPKSTWEWLLLIAIGVSGFLLQVLLTEGLQRERAGRATNIIYTQLVSALILERIFWGTTPPMESFIGSVLIIGAAVWVGLQKKQQPAKAPVTDEEQRLLDEGRG